MPVRIKTSLFVALVGLSWPTSVSAGPGNSNICDDPTETRLARPGDPLNSDDIGPDPFSESAWELYLRRTDLDGPLLSAHSRANFGFSVLYKRAAANCAGQGPYLVDSRDFQSSLLCRRLGPTKDQVRSETYKLIFNISSSFKRDDMVAIHKLNLATLPAHCRGVERIEFGPEADAKWAERFIEEGMSEWEESVMTTTRGAPRRRSRSDRRRVCPGASGEA